MNTENNEQNKNTGDGGIRPLGYWLRTVDALISREFAAAFEGEGVTRRDWMLLNVVSGDVTAPGFAERLARKGKRLRGLERRGWVEEAGDGTWILTDEGRAAKDRLGAVVDGIRSRVAGAVSPEDFATTVASLEAIARELGWDENERMPRPGVDRRFGRGPGARPSGEEGYGPERGFRPGFGPGFGPHSMWGGSEHVAHHGRDSHHGHEHECHGHGRGHHRGRNGESAYERGFNAGFSRGRAEAS